MKDKVFPISMTILWSIVFGTSMHNWTIGICLGLLMGMVFGLFNETTGKDKEEK